MKNKIKGNVLAKARNFMVRGYVAAVATVGFLAVTGSAHAAAAIPTNIDEALDSAELVTDKWIAIAVPVALAGVGLAIIKRIRRA